MCDPFTASVALAGAQSVYQGYQQDQRADALNDYQKELHDANVRNAQRAAVTEFEALDRRQMEERRRASDAVADIARQSRLAVGRVLATSESTAGNSVATLLGEFERQEAQRTSTVRFNLRETEAQLALERLGVRAREADRIASTIPKPIPGADWLGLGLGFASDFFKLKMGFDEVKLAGTNAGASGNTSEP